jgi:predicted CoA-binding protein
MDQIGELSLLNADEEEIRLILGTYRRIAIVGLSANEERPSYKVARYLKEKGFIIYPVNPAHEMVLGERCYPNLTTIPHPIEIVDIFRKPSAVTEIVHEAIKCSAQVIWMQVGIVNNQAAHIAQDANMKVVMDRCILVEHKRFFV